MSAEDNPLERTSELNFRYQETRTELDMIKKEYSDLSEAFSELESQCVGHVSNIESLKLALKYNSSYQIAKESDYKNRIQELEEAVKAKCDEKDALCTKFTKQINVKEAYIENLLTTLLNLHQKIEYYKDDLSDLKKNYESQKKTLESESAIREVTENLYMKTLNEFEEFKTSISEIKQEYVEQKSNTEEIVKDMKSNFEAEHLDEILKMKKMYEGKINSLVEAYNAKMNNQEKSQKELVASFREYMHIRLDNLKNDYERRITNMIQDYSFQEAKFESRTSSLQNLLANLQNKYLYIEEELIGKASCIGLINDERKLLLTQKQELDKFIEKREIENFQRLTEATTMLEETKKQFEKFQEDAKIQYEKRLKILSSKKTISIEGIRKRYNKKLDKLKKDSEEDMQKLKKFYETQNEYLLEELAKLETAKTDLEIRLECDVKEIKNDAEFVRDI